MEFIIFGQVGSDAGWWVIGRDGVLHHVGGWDPEGMAEVVSAVNIMREATRLKTPGLAQSVVKTVADFAANQLGEHLKGAGERTIIIVGG